VEILSTEFKLTSEQQEALLEGAKAKLGLTPAMEKSKTQRRPRQ
jgi:hypothetical protein